MKEQVKLYGPDHLRALAILLVWVFHYQGGTFEYPEWSTAFKAGWTGVDLFFVLSGFLISSQLFAQIRRGGSISLREFYIKRFFRIIPIYVLVVAIYFLFPFFREKEALPPLWKFLTFTQNLGLNRVGQGTFSHAWSLCVEEHFYLFLPITLLILQYTNKFKNAWWLLIVFFIGGVIVRLYSWHYLYLSRLGLDNDVDYWAMYLYYPTYGRLDGLLSGVAIAAVYQFLPKTRERISQYGNQMILVSVLLLAFAFVYLSKLNTYSTSIIGFPFISIAFGLMVAGALSPSAFLYKWKSNATSLIATLSYGIYLTHKGIIHIVQEVFSKWGIEKDGSIMLVMSLIFCVMVAWLLHLVIEKPFMKMRERFLTPVVQAIPIPVPVETIESVKTRSGN
jgi:peptidoglycan/LPS O-acetylase OafA/YrhL